MSDTEKPLVTFALFAYNQEEFIRDAVLGAFAQSYDSLEIILSDDCSSDNTFNIMEDLFFSYSGRHNIKLLRNNVNIGLISHVNKVIGCSSGELIVLAAGDDISLSNRVNRIVECYVGNKKPMLIHSRAIEIDRSDKVLIDKTIDYSIFKKINYKNIASSYSVYLGASGACSREMFNKYGIISFLGAYEDLIFGFRAVIEDKIFFIDDDLLYYRVGVGISRGGAGTLKGEFSNRKRLVKVHLDVVRQRIMDFDRSGLDLYYVRDALIKELIIKELINFFYQREWRKILSVNCGFFTVIKNILKEILLVISSVVNSRRNL